CIRDSPATDAVARESIETALRWIREHPGEEAKGIEMLRAIVAKFGGTSYARQAEAEIKNLSARLDAECRAVLDELKRQADPLIEKGELLKAAEIYALYEGWRAAETMVQRTSQANVLRSKYEELERRRTEETMRLQEAVRDGMEAVAGKLLKEGIPAALSKIGEILGDDSLKPIHARFLALKDFLDKARNVDSQIAESFMAQKGQEITVQLVGGPCRMVITDVKDGRVFGEQRVVVGDAVGSRTFSFSLADLAVQERLQRLGSNTEPEVLLVKGLLAAGAQRYNVATNYFAATPPELREFLIALVAAKQDEDVSRTSAKDKPPASTPREEAVEPVPDTEPVLGALVSKNQGLARRDIRTEQDEKGMVTRVTITSSQLADLSPLAALKSIKELRCYPDRAAGSAAKSRLQDLSPLRGLSLERLEVPRSLVRDLRPLQGMPLRRLDVSDTEVSDLTPLQGMPLEALIIGNTKVRFLAPIAGMRLRLLDLRNLTLSDFRGLEGLPLEDLKLDGANVWDLSVLSGMPLKRLVLSNTRFANFSQLAGLPLEYLDLSRSLVRAKDLAVLKGMPLRELDLSDTWVAEVSALRGLPLERLSLARTPVRDFTPLHGCRLQSLDLAGTSVEDLSWLRDMPLRRLNISRTNVRDLSPIRDLPLEELDCRNIRAAEFSPLMGTGIQVLWIDEADLSPTMLRYLPRLRVLNGVDLRAQNIREWLLRDWRPRRRN
ncbi:MAG: hypothetical protein N2255_01380, partial [Kiritimatiellae bacterium]|nr:hypothetical protein [Kiritimatiellia bacterium]